MLFFIFRALVDRVNWYRVRFCLFYVDVYRIERLPYLLDGYRSMRPT